MNKKSATIAVNCLNIVCAGLTALTMGTDVVYDQTLNDIAGQYSTNNNTFSIDIVPSQQVAANAVTPAQYPDVVLPGLSNPGASTGAGGMPSGGSTASQPPPATDSDVSADVAAGLYSLEDYNYLVALSGESSSYEGFYAVACSVRNRVQSKGISYKAVVTAAGQYAGYSPKNLGKPANDDIKRAAIAVLKGGPSTVGTCTFFFGRVNGKDMWAEPNVSEFYNWGGNVYYNKWGELHNSKDTKTAGAIVIYEAATKTWKYPSGTKGP